jgi:type I restriction enzyme M protein
VNRRSAKATVQATTAQSLGSLIKSARDIMRKDKGLNGDLDRLPMLTWIMFLKFLDDLELQRETEASLAGKKFQRAIDPPYRWRDWAAKPEGITGDELISFVNNEEAVLPDGSRGPGLFAYLRSLTGRNGGDRRDVIATVFKGTINRMINGYLLRDVINKVGGIHFGSSEELHTLGSLYESMLREMRDAAGDSGEFEEFGDCMGWWNRREENDRAWKVSAAELLANGCNLDRKNPRAKEDITHLPPEQLAADILKKEQRIAEIMGNIRDLLAKHGE